MMEKKVRASIRQIAETYGYESQSRQCIEEMAELTQAINKLWRAQVEAADLVPIRKNVIDEMADVQIMLWQMEFLLLADDGELKAAIKQKINRQLKRIEKQDHD